VKGINKVILVGNLGSDPETRHMTSGSVMCTFNVATSETWKDKQTGQPQERTEWHRIVIFNRLAEIAGEYLKKGSKVYLEGALRTRKWQDQQGQDRYTTEIVVSELQMLDNKGGGDTRQHQQPTQQERSTANDYKQAKNQPMQAAVDFEDDIPF